MLIYAYFWRTDKTECLMCFLLFDILQHLYSHAMQLVNVYDRVFYCLLLSFFSFLCPSLILYIQMGFNNKIELILILELAQLKKKPQKYISRQLHTKIRKGDSNHYGSQLELSYDIDCKISYFKMNSISQTLFKLFSSKFI